MKVLDIWRLLSNKRCSYLSACAQNARLILEQYSEACAEPLDFEQGHGASGGGSSPAPSASASSACTSITGSIMRGVDAPNFSIRSLIRSNSALPSTLVIVVLESIRISESFGKRYGNAIDAAFILVPTSRFSSPTKPMSTDKGSFSEATMRL